MADLLHVADRLGGLEDLARRCLANSARFRGWQCTEKLMARAADALYLHCLPADITGGN